MADGDEEEFFALGTPFEQLEDDAPRKKPVPIHEQVVTDDRGRRRFHGAFTGGFSAGYFNTVDTKEGWTPKTFVSSRSQKTSERVTQRPEDFMDEEDLSEFGIAPKRVVTTEKFLPSRSDDSTSGKIPSGSTGGAGSAVLGANLLQDLIVPVKMSVGIKLLSQMGWKEGQGVGPRVRREAKKTYGCIGPPGTGPDGEDDIYAVGLFFAPKDVESLEFTSKDDLHGIGYSGINPRTALQSQTDWLGMGTSASRIGIRGQGFGVGALEEDDEDIYAQDNLSKYDVELNTSKPQRRNDLHGWSGPQQSSGQGGMLSIFCKASKPPPARKHYPPPVVPRDFKPFHKTEETTQPKQPLSGPPINQGQKRQEANQTSKRLTAKERGEALGEVPLPTPKKSIFDYIAEEDKTRLKESKEKANTSQQRSSKSLENNDLDRRFTSRGPLSTSGFKPFAKEPEKQARYEIYLSGKSDRDMPSQTDSKMTEWERECEQEEFARAASLYRDLSQTMAARFTSAKDTDEKPSGEGSVKEDQSTAANMKMFGALTRERFEWHPGRILCKRFNIPDPYPGSGVTGVVMDRRDKPNTDQSVIREVKAIEYKPHLSEPDDETKSTGHQDEAEMVQKPSALIAGFQSIVSQRKQPSYQDNSTRSSTERTNKEEQNKTEQNTDAGVIKRAPMDLFNEIFAESSSESESESEENEEAEQQTVDLDVQDNEERNKESIEKKGAPPVSNAPVLVPEGNMLPETLEREKEPSPETFGPSLPSLFGGNTARTSKGFDFSTRVDSPRRQEKQKRRKKKRRKDKETGSDLSDSNDENRRRRKDKKKRSKKKESDFNDSNEEYKKKKRKKKAKERETDSEWSDSDEQDTRKKKKRTSEKYKDRNLTDSENEEFTRSKKKKKRSTYSDSDEKYDKQKRNKRRNDNSDDESNNGEHKYRKKKRKDKEKSVKERKKYSDKTKKSDRQEYEEIQYEPEEYVEKVARDVVGEKPLSTFDSTGSSGYRKSNSHGKIKDSGKETTKKDARNYTNSRTDNDSAKEQEISRVPDNKEIINKLKNIQMLKEKKRMRAADFM